MHMMCVANAAEELEEETVFSETNAGELNPR